MIVSGIVSEFNRTHGKEIECRLVHEDAVEAEVEFRFSICEDSADDYFEDMAFLIEERTGKIAKIDNITKDGDVYIVKFSFAGLGKDV